MSARAQGHNWLDWKAPPECPPAAVIEGRVVEWLGEPPPEPPALAVKAQVVWQEAHWEVVVNIAHQEQVGQRSVAVATCQEAADFVAVAVVLAVDPARADALPVPGERAAAVGSVAQTGSAQQSGTQSAAPEVAKEAEANAIEESEAPSERPVEVPPKGPRMRWAVTAEAEGAYGSLPGVSWGVDVGGGLDLNALSLRLVGRWLPPREVEPSGAAGPIAFSLLAGRVEGVYRFGPGRLSAGPLLSVSVGAIATRQRDVQSDAKFEPWAAFGVGGALFVRVFPWVSVMGQVEFEVPLTQPSFILDNGTLVHEVGLGGRAALGLKIYFSKK